MPLPVGGLRPSGRVIASVLLTLAIAAATGGCTDDAEETAGENSERLEFEGERGDLSPADVRASAAEVAGGLGEIVGYSTEVADTLADDPERAASAQEKILPIWESVLGTVKANDETVFQTFSDGFAELAAAVTGGDTAAARNAADAIQETTEDYLREHPGDTDSPSPRPGG